MSINSVSELLDTIRRTTSRWADQETLKFWGSRISESSITKLDDNTYRFVSSEHNFDRTARLYTVRQVTFGTTVREDGRTVGTASIETVSNHDDFQAYGTLTTAKRHLHDSASA